MTKVNESSASPRNSRFILLCSLVVLLGFALRVFYAFDAKPVDPIRGDINEYVLYAWNLKQSKTFSSTLPNQGPILADNYRGPGYPLLLAGAMSLAGNAQLYLRPADAGRMVLVADPSTWMMYVFFAQALLGALSILLTIALARRWLSYPASVFAGLITALWPHSIVFSATLLSETLFGFLLMLAIWLLSKCEESDRKLMMAALAGLAFAAGYLVNPIIALFPILTAAALMLNRKAHIATVLLIVYLFVPLAWMARNASLESPHGVGARIAQNFVQGSWPQFLTALNSRFANDISAQIVQAEAEEERAFVADPVTGMSSVMERMSVDPGYYASWYLLKKPFLLWDWNLAVGWGDIYFLVTPNSPFKRVLLLKATKQVFEAMNPILFGLAAIAAFSAAFGSLRRRSTITFALAITAWMALYLTAVHTVLQAEPRYSIPYRPLEVLLAITAVSWTYGLFQSWRSRRAKKITVKVTEAAG